MPRIEPVEQDGNPKARELLAAVEKKMGMVPNMMATLAHSPTALQAYLGFSQTLGGGTLPRRCATNHRWRSAKPINAPTASRPTRSSAARRASARPTFSTPGMERPPTRRATPHWSSPARSSKSRGTSAKKMSRKFVGQGYTDGEIVEIVANVALNIFTNYFNHVADPEIDFPRVPALATV